MSFKKQNLENGDLIKTKEGSVYIKIDDRFINIETGVILYESGYDENLMKIHRYMSQDDVVKVMHYNISSLYHLRNNREWTYDKTKEILTEKEREYLSSIIKPFKHKVESLIKLPFSKIDTNDSAYIRISLTNNENISLPVFWIEEHYVNMKLGEEYILEKLNLN